MAERLMPGLERRLKAELSGRRAISTASPAAATPPTPRTTRSCRSAWSSPRTMEEAERAIAHCPREKASPCWRAAAAPRSAGQTVNRFAGHRLLEISQPRFSTSTSQAARCTVEPGIVLDDLNRAAQAARPVVSGRHLDRLARHHRRHGGNNSCGARSLRYGNMRDNVIVDRRAAGRRHARRISARSARDLVDVPPRRRCGRWREICLAIGAREADEIAARFPKVQRRVGGYNLDALVPGKQRHQPRAYPGRLARARSASRPRIELKLSPLLGRRAVGACHFGSFHEAMDAAQHIVKLGADRGRAGRPHHDRAGARHRDVPADARRFVRGDAGGDPAGRVRRGRPGRKPAPAAAAHGADGRSRLRLGQQRRQMGRRGRGARSRTAGRDHRGAHRRPQHHDVDEGGGKAGLLRRGLRGAARASRRLHRRG